MELLSRPQEPLASDRACWSDESRSSNAELEHLNGFQSSQDLVRSNHGTVLPIEICEAHGVNLSRGSPGSMPILAAEREGRILDQEGLEAEVPGHPDGGF